MSSGFDSYPDLTFDGLEAMEAKAEVLMEAVIEQMEAIARDLIEPDELSIAVEKRRAACLQLCADTFDRLDRQWCAGVKRHRV